MLDDILQMHRPVHTSGLPTPLQLADILSEIETLSFSQRFRRMVELGRQSLTDTMLFSILNDMEHGDFYQLLLKPLSSLSHLPTDV